MLTNHAVLLLQERSSPDKSCDAYLDELFAAETMNGAKAIYVEAGMRSKMELQIG